MRVRRFIVVFLVSGLSACADFYGGQQPAPVYGSKPGDNYGSDPYLGMPDNPRAAMEKPPEIIQTKPLEGLNKAPEMVEIKPDFPPTVESVPAQPDVAQENPFGQPNEATDQPGAGQSSENQQSPESEPPAEVPKPAEIVAPALPEVAKDPETLELLESFAPQSPAIGSLVMAANENSQSGNYDSAVSSIERAIRIEPRNATLYYKLAVVRLKQSKPRLAEDLARKAAILAADDNNLKKHSWLLIANARELQSNVDGAKKAKAEAAKY